MSNAAAIARIDAVRRVADELYDARDEDGQRRDLELHEQLFLDAVNHITRGFNNTRTNGHRVWGDGVAYDALCSLSYREEAAKLEAALASYRAICAELDGIADDIAELGEIYADAAE